jgi:hypothetical protein
MALTLITNPERFDNKAAWEVSTSVVEDSSHVNVRVEAHVYKNAEITCKKVMPKGYTYFDFANMLASLVRFENYFLIDYPGVKMLYPIDDGPANDLVTGWTNDGTYPFGTFTSSGNQITSAIKTSSANPGIAKSNVMTVVKGKLYVVVWHNGQVNSMTDASTLQLTGTEMSVVKFPTVANNSKFYMVRLGNTNNIQLELKCNANKAVNFSAGNLSVYPLTDVDWYVPYYIKFIEKYENSSGITQTGATLDLSTDLYLFFKSEASVFTDFLLGTTTSKFLVAPDVGYVTADNVDITVDDTTITADGYSGVTRAVNHSIPKTVLTGKVSHYYGMIVPQRLECAVVRKQYNISFVLQSTVVSFYEWSYHPIMMVHVDQTIVGTYPIIGIMIRYWDNLLAGGTGAGVDASEEIFVTALSTVYPQIVNLIWKNSLGGYSAFQFYSGIEKGIRTGRNYYKNSNFKNRILSINETRYVSASTRAHLTTAQMEYVADLLLSDQVFWQQDEGLLTPVCVITESGITERNDDIMQFTVEFEY